MKTEQLPPLKRGIIPCLLFVMVLLTGCPVDHHEPVINDARILPVNPILQQTPEWCWAASAQMIFQHYGLPPLNSDFQCGIVAAYFGPSSSCWSYCYSCIVGISTASDFQILINNYGLVANQFGANSRVLTSNLLFRGLTLQEIAQEIRNNRVIFAGISPSGFGLPNLSQHATVIVGYDATGPVPMVIVNDPWPYDLPIFGVVPNPYLNAGGVEIKGGQFKVSLAAFTSLLQWANTLDLIQ